MSFLYFAPNSNKNNNKSNKKSSKNNTPQGKGRNIPKNTMTRKTNDMGMQAVISSLMSNSLRQSRPATFSRPQKSTGGTVKLSKCCAKYAFAISDPFSPLATGVCVPAGQATASHKVTGFIRLDSKIGTAGFAFVAISPSGARDAPQVLFSNASYTRSSIAILNAAGTALGTGVQSATVTNLPYTVDNLISRSGEDSQELLCRVASAGLSVQYTGTALNQSGMAYLYRDPSHKNVTLTPGSITNMKVSELSANPLTTVCNFTRDRCSVSDFAATPMEMNFASNLDIFGAGVAARTGLVYPYSGGEGDLSNASDLASVLGYTSPGTITYNQGVPTTVIIITGQAGQDFHIEYVIHAEYVGNLAAASYSPTDSDVQGAGMVLEAANGIQQRKTSKPEASTWSLMYEGLAYAAKKAVPLVIPLAEKALLSLLA